MFLVDLFIFSLTISYLIHIHAKQMSILARNNIPGPAPNIIWGNLPEINATTRSEYHLQLVKQYGKICGYYSGQRPHVVVADLELIKAIQIKDFNKFSDRPHLALKNGLNPHEIMNH